MKVFICKSSYITLAFLKRYRVAFHWSQASLLSAKNGMLGFSTKAQKGTSPKFQVDLVETENYVLVGEEFTARKWPMNENVVAFIVQNGTFSTRGAKLSKGFRLMFISLVWWEKIKMRGGLIEAWIMSQNTHWLKKWQVSWAQKHKICKSRESNTSHWRPKHLHKDCNFLWDSVHRSDHSTRLHLSRHEIKTFSLLKPSIASSSIRPMICTRNGHRTKHLSVKSLRSHQVLWFIQTAHNMQSTFHVKTTGRVSLYRRTQITQNGHRSNSSNGTSCCCSFWRLLKAPLVAKRPRLASFCPHINMTLSGNKEALMQKPCLTKLRRLRKI